MLGRIRRGRALPSRPLREHRGSRGRARFREKNAPLRSKTREILFKLSISVSRKLRKSFAGGFWLQGGGTGSGRPGRSAKQGPHGAYHTSRLRDSGWSQPGHTVRCPDAGTGEQGPVPTGTCSVHTGYCVCPCVPCVPYVSRLPPVRACVLSVVEIWGSPRCLFTGN